MKKIIDYSILAILAAAASAIVFQFDVGKELGVFIKSVTQKLAPWVNTSVYS